MAVIAGGGTTMRLTVSSLWQAAVTGLSRVRLWAPGASDPWGTVKVAWVQAFALMAFWATSLQLPRVTWSKGVVPSVRIGVLPSIWRKVVPRHVPAAGRPGRHRGSPG